MANKLKKFFAKIHLPKLYQNKKFQKVAIVLGILIVVLALGTFIYNLSFSNKVFPKTYLGSLNLGGKSKEEARQLIDNKINNAGQVQVSLKTSEETWTLKPEELAISYDKDATLDTIWNVGRRGGLGKIVTEQLKSIFSKNQKQAVFAYNQGKLIEFLNSIALKTDIPEKDATIVVKDLNPEITDEKEGQKLDYVSATQEVLLVLGSLESKESQLRIDKIYPKITKENAQAAKEKTIKILSSRVILKSEKQTYTLEPNDLVNWLSFVGVLGQRDVQDEDSGNLKLKDKKSADVWVLDVQVDSDVAQEYVGKLSSEINQEPKDAKFEIKGGKAVAFQISQTGYELDKEKSLAIIAKAILSDDKKSVVLPVVIKEPEVTSNSAESLGIKELIGEGTTNFSGSPQNRRHNISVGANSFHGVLLKPGEEFSTLKYLGQIDASTGYLPELVIKEDRTIPEYGGGLCQVSTTMFRATMDAGFKITERQNHSYRVRYYEPPVGMDATIYYPAPDFKFVNDYESYVLIQTELSGNNLTFRFYGTKDGRRSEKTDPYIYDVTGSGEPVYTESADLAPGEIKQVETAHPGSKATFTYTVYDASGKVTNEQKFDSAYVPWPARYLYGPGTQIPPPPSE